MNWKTYQLVFRLCSPMHIGHRKVGNIQRTYPYVTGRVLWGALTARLTRQKAGNQPATSSSFYEKVGKALHQQIAFTYFFPTTHCEGKVEIWPWDNDFQHSYLHSYSSTALYYPMQSAAEASLHEVEYISPYTLNDGRPVYLSGYLFVQQDEILNELQVAAEHLQLGGERCYGWGLVKKEKFTECNSDVLFDQCTVAMDEGWPPVLRLKKEQRLLAHTLAIQEPSQAVSFSVAGSIEPLLGRETKTDGRWGAHVSQASICFTPGSSLKDDASFQIGPYGVWKVHHP